MEISLRAEIILAQEPVVQVSMVLELLVWIKAWCVTTCTVRYSEEVLRPQSDHMYGAHFVNELRLAYCQ